LNKKKRRRELEICIAVLQNGVNIANSIFQNSKDFSVTMSQFNKSKYKIWIPCYYFYDEERPLLECRRGVIFLRGLIGCTGMGTSKGEPVRLDERLKDDSFLELELDDYISYGLKDLRILIKIRGRSKKTKYKIEDKSFGYIAPLRKVFINDSVEKISLVPSGIISLILIGSIIGGLLNNKFERPKEIKDIPSEYILPFISARYLNSAPELLKDNLNVNNIIADIMNYNQQAVQILMGSTDHASLLSSNTINEYRQQFKEQSRIANEAFAIQRSIDEFQINSSQKNLVLVPTIGKETLRGTSDRILDKVNLILSGAEQSLNLRRKIISDFKADSPHIYEEYQNIEESTKKADTLKQIKPWNQLTTEEQLYAKVKNLSEHAGSIKNTENTQSEVYSPIGITPGSNFLTFILDETYTLDLPLDSKTNGKQFKLVETQTAKNVPVKSPILNPEKIEKFIHNHKYQLQICYEIALQNDDQSAGSMEWKWKVDQTGRIFDVSLIAANINNEKMIRCIREKIAQWKFPSPLNGVVEISFPFEFSPSKG
jgi:hypothetical protein